MIETIPPYNVAIYYGAPEYQDQPEGRKRLAELEAEFGLKGEETSIGTGAEGPGIVFLIPDIAPLVVQYGLTAWGALSLGKDITGTVQFYVKAAKKLARFVNGHHTYLERDGAFILAVNAVLEHHGKTPKSIVIDGYDLGQVGPDPSDDVIPLTGIANPPPHSGAWLQHHFQFLINGKKIVKAVVDSDEVRVIDLSPPKKTKKTKKKEKKKNKKEKKGRRKAAA